MTRRLSLASMPHWPLGLDRVQAASYLGIGTDLFDQLVEAGTLPRARELGRRRIWHRGEIEAAFTAMPGGFSEPPMPEPNEWDSLHET